MELRASRSRGGIKDSKWFFREMERREKCFRLGSVGQDMETTKFSKEEIRARRIFRLAQIIYDHWEEGSGMDTRYFDHPFIHDEYVVNGRSGSGGSYREHAVPRAYLRDQCLLLYARGADVDSVARILEGNLRIVLISGKEADALNRSYKTEMPEGWRIGEGDPLERFHRLGIGVLP